MKEGLNKHIKVTEPTFSGKNINAQNGGMGSFGSKINTF